MAITTDRTYAPPMTLSMEVGGGAQSLSVEEAANPSFHCISRPALWFYVDREGWGSTEGVGVVTPATYVRRGTVTRSNNG